MQNRHIEILERGLPFHLTQLRWNLLIFDKH